MIAHLRDKTKTDLDRMDVIDSQLETIGGEMRASSPDMAKVKAAEAEIKKAVRLIRAENNRALEPPQRT